MVADGRPSGLFGGSTPNAQAVQNNRGNPSVEDRRNIALDIVGSAAFDPAFTEHDSELWGTTMARYWLCLIAIGVVPVLGCPSAGPLQPVDNGGTENGNTNGDVESCPTAQESFALMTPATYAVVVTYQRGPSDLVNFTLGTAFGLDARNLATNAHVVAGILDNPFPVERVVVVQAGTGAAAEVTHAIAHPRYTGNPVASPDVGLLRTRDDIPAFLALATEAELAEMAVGDDVYLAGFPGDVNELFGITPGITVPQATALAGSISALRSFDPTTVVTAGTTDFLQHQIPTTPGTSGSALLRCGKVAGVHNAGTVKLVPVLDEDGNISVDRQAAAANNFAIHVRHLTDLLQDPTAESSAIPPPDPDFSGFYTCEAYRLDTGNPVFTHDFVITILRDGTMAGLSFWSNVTLALDGYVDRFGDIDITDDGPSLGYLPITYIGYVNLGNELLGLYFEGSSRLGIWGCSKEE